ncbi:5-oxoprolinase subunit PxpB [uncultured Winogradskyella sp.]|uniref:5-oxoprolinase subunit PxpB n=1 Tax=uncultured Winogradskyella sp. TaxID=395353 RepID=UPI002611C2E4|nr:5-oxoprolinase subunit PxpB [uncultured Winogradskyella sp.]
MIYNLKYSRYNESSILIEWKAIIDENILQDVLRFKFLIENNNIKQKVEVISTYNSLLIVYDYAIDSFNSKIFTLKSLYLQQNESESTKPSHWKIPVCYADQFAIDLENFSNQKKLSKSEITKLHSDTIYTVFFIGFLPGFLYLGGLDSRLFLDRKTTPNLNVKKGSVAIGGQQTGIYPQDSPGGWHIIGNSPIELFNTNSNPPCFIKAGDKIQFQSISVSEHNTITRSLENSLFNLKSLKCD